MASTNGNDNEWIVTFNTKANIVVDEEDVESSAKAAFKKAKDIFNKTASKFKNLSLDLGKFDIKSKLNYDDLDELKKSVKYYQDSFKQLTEEYNSLEYTFEDKNLDESISKIKESFQSFDQIFNDFENDVANKCDNIYNAIYKIFGSENLTDINSLVEVQKYLSNLLNTLDKMGVYNFNINYGGFIKDGYKAIEVFNTLERIIGSGEFNTNVFSQITQQIKDLGANVSEVEVAVRNFIDEQNIPGFTEPFNQLKEEILEAQSLLKNGTFDYSDFEKMRDEILQTRTELINLGLTIPEINQKLKYQDMATVTTIKSQLTGAINSYKKIQDDIQNIDVTNIRNSSGTVSFQNYATTFSNTQDAADKCAEHIRTLLSAEQNYILSIQRDIDQDNQLKNFTINLKRASGEVESLRYALKDVDIGNDESEQMFLFQGMTTNNAGIEKQLNAIEKAAKSTETALSKLNSSTDRVFENTQMYKDVQDAIEGLRNGTVTVDEVNSKMETLKKHTEEFKSAMQTGKSLNMFVNMDNDIQNMDNTIKNITDAFDALTVKPEELSKEIQRLNQQAENLNNLDRGTIEYANAFKELKENVASVNKEIQNQQKSTSTIYNIADLDDEIVRIQDFTGTVENAQSELKDLFYGSEYTNLKVTGVEEANGQVEKLKVSFTDAEGAVKEFTMSCAQLKDGNYISKGLIQDSDVKVIKTATDAQKEYNKVQEKTASLLTKYSSTSNIQQNNMSMFGTWDSTSINNMRKTVDEYESIVSTLRNAYQEDTGTFDKSLLGDIDLTKVNQQLSSLSTTISKLMSEIKNQVGGGSLATIIGNLDVDKYKDQLDVFSNSIANIGKGENKTALDNAKMQLQDIVAEMEKAAESNDFDTMNVAAKKFNSTLEEANNTLNSINNSGGGSIFGKVINGITSGYQTLTKIIGTGFVTRELRSIAKEMVNTVTEIDEAMAQLQIVTGATSSEMTDFLESSTKLAKELGQSITDVLSSVETYSRLGYNLEEASNLAEFTAILSNVASVDMEEATTGLTSVIKGFGMAVDDVEHVSDVLVNIGQNYAVSAGEILEAFEKSSAALAATGTTFEESAAIIAAGKLYCLENIEIYFQRTRLIARTA